MKVKNPRAFDKKQIQRGMKKPLHSMLRCLWFCLGPRSTIREIKSMHVCSMSQWNGPLINMDYMVKINFTSQFWEIIEGKPFSIILIWKISNPRTSWWWCFFWREGSFFNPGLKYTKCWGNQDFPGVGESKHADQRHWVTINLHGCDILRLCMLILKTLRHK